MAISCGGEDRPTNLPVLLDAIPHGPTDNETHKYQEAWIASNSVTDSTLSIRHKELFMCGGSIQNTTDCFFIAGWCCTAIAKQQYIIKRVKASAFGYRQAPGSRQKIS